MSDGKPANHIPTKQVCTLCHTNPASYKPGVMNHSGITSGCTTCHAVGATGTAFFGVTPVPQGSGHIPSSSDCVTCHASTSKFGPGTGMQHTGISSGCATCHDTGKAFTGVTNLKTKPTNHVPTTATCETCHAAGNFTSFAGTQMQHTGISSGCTTCHAASATGTPFFGVTPLPQGSGHIPTTADCVTCHASTSKFGPGTAMNHTPVAGTPCATCHETGKSFTGVTIVTRPTPAQDANHPKTGDCATCHTSTVSFTMGITSLPANHIPTTAACISCHAGGSTTPGSGVINHTAAAITSGCINCHAASAAGKAFLGVTPMGQGVGHLPSGANGCESCHAATKFDKFGPNTGMNHAVVAGVACANCHAVGTGITGTPPVKTPPGNHVPIGNAACESCHTASNFTTFQGNSVTLMKHAVVAGTPCATCHEGGLSFVGAPAVVTRPTPAQDPAHPTDRRVRDVPQLDDVVHHRRDRQAGEPHSDQCGVHAVPPESAGVVQARDDGPHGYQQRLHDVPCGRCDGDGVLWRDTGAAGVRTHPDVESTA